MVVIGPEESGLPVRSAINCSQLATIQKEGPGSRLRARRGEATIRAIGSLGPATMARVEAAIKFNLGLQ